MRLTLVLLALWMLAKEARADATINAIVGDASWAGQPGRPDDADADADVSDALGVTPDAARAAHEVARIRAHLRFVHARLVAADVSHLAPAARQARAAALADLARYAERGEFPRRTGDPYAGRRPRFIDDRGVHCAVGQLIADSGAPELARAINAHHEYDHVLDMHEPALAAWADAHGFTALELATIQPGYSPVPTKDATRRQLLEEKDRIALACAREHPMMSSLFVHVTGTDRGAAIVTTKSSDPFARCFVRLANQVETGGGAYMGRPERYYFAIDLTFTPAQTQFERRVATFGGGGGSCMRPGPIVHAATVDVASTRQGLAVRVTTTPANPAVARCIEGDTRRALADFASGAWQLHATRTFPLEPRVVLTDDVLRAYATEVATECEPTPAAGAKMTVTVTAKPDDAQFSIAVTGSAELAACVSAALQPRLAAQFMQYVDGAKFFRIDAPVDRAVTFAIESKAARLERLEQERQRMQLEIERARYGL